MNRSLLHVGNTVEVKVDACRQRFAATVTGLDEPGWVRIQPIDRWPTWRRVRIADVVERVDPPMRRRRARA
jgi:hypothetical protein